MGKTDKILVLNYLILWINVLDLDSELKPNNEWMTLRTKLSKQI